MGRGSSLWPRRWLSLRGMMLNRGPMSTPSIKRGTTMDYYAGIDVSLETEQRLRGGFIGRSCLECGGNSLATCSGHVKVPLLRRRGQEALARLAERGFPSRLPFASGSGRRRAMPRATSARVPAQGSTVCVLIRRRNSSFSRSMALVVRADFHCNGSRRVKVKSR